MSFRKVLIGILTVLMLCTGCVASSEEKTTFSLFDAITWETSFDEIGELFSPEYTIQADYGEDGHHSGVILVDEPGEYAGNTYWRVLFVFENDQMTSVLMRFKAEVVGEYENLCKPMEECFGETVDVTGSALITLGDVIMYGLDAMVDSKMWILEDETLVKLVDADGAELDEHLYDLWFNNRSIRKDPN